jgi:chromosome segregation ATPase
VIIILVGVVAIYWNTRQLWQALEADQGQLEALESSRRALDTWRGSSDIQHSEMTGQLKEFKAQVYKRFDRLDEMSKEIAELRAELSQSKDTVKELHQQILQCTRHVVKGNHRLESDLN